MRYSPGNRCTTRNNSLAPLSVNKGSRTASNRGQIQQQCSDRQCRKTHFRAPYYDFGQNDPPPKITRGGPLSGGTSQVHGGTNLTIFRGRVLELCPIYCVQVPNGLSHPLPLPGVSINHGVGVNHVPDHTRSVWDHFHDLWDPWEPPLTWCPSEEEGCFQQMFMAFINRVGWSIHLL